MDNLITDADLRVVKETGMYPSKDDCYEVEVLDPKTGQFMFKITHMPKVEYSIIMKLKELARTGIPQDMVKELIDDIEKYGQYKFERGGLESDEEYHM
jgi:hypothetical protein